MNSLQPSHTCPSAERATEPTTASRTDPRSQACGKDSALVRPTDRGHRSMRTEAAHTTRPPAEIPIKWTRSHGAH
eukprot:14201008-Alexandrium_andersonii.AAC.1